MVARREVVYVEYVQLQLPIEHRVEVGGMPHADLVKGLNRFLPKLLQVMAHGDGVVKVYVAGGKVKACPITFTDMGMD